jgi:hypothetical protein
VSEGGTHGPSDPSRKIKEGRIKGGPTQGRREVGKALASTSFTLYGFESTFLLVLVAPPLLRTRADGSRTLSTYRF